MSRPPWLVIGATGMLGRPVVRRLLQDGVPLRALARDAGRARRLLPSGCEIVNGDLRDESSLDQAMQDVAGVYINLAAPMTRRPPAFDPERDGTAAIVGSARRHDVPHLVRISALGVEDMAPDWWAAQHKADADRSIIESGIAYTIFRPTWFMESLPSFLLGPVAPCPNLADAPLRWIAGDDYARQVSAALTRDSARNRIYHPQGPERLTLSSALRRFARALDRRIMPIRVPGAVLRVAGLVHGRTSYFAHLLDMTRRHFSRLDRTALPTDLPEARMTVEQYAEYTRATGDLPRK